MKLTLVLIASSLLGLAQPPQTTGQRNAGIEERAAAARLVPAPKAATIAFSVTLADGSQATETIDVSLMPDGLERLKNWMIASGAVKIADFSAATFVLGLHHDYVSFRLGAAMLDERYQSKADADAAAAAKKADDAAKAKKAADMQKILNPPKQ